MQNGFNSNMGSGLGPVRSCSGGSADTVLNGSQVRNGNGLPLTKSSADSRGRSNSLTGSLGKPAADSRAVRHDSPDSPHKSGLESLARSGGAVSVPRVRHVPSSVSLTSSGSSGERGTFRRGQRSLSPIRTEVRAAAVFAHTGQGEGGSLVRVPGKAGAGDSVRGHFTQDPPDAGMDHDAPPGDLAPKQRGGKKTRRRRRKQNQQPNHTQGQVIYTTPARRQWAAGTGPFASHHLSGSGTRRNWRGDQRWHSRRRPMWTGSEEDVRRHFHAGRTPGPRGRRHQTSDARR